MNGLSIRSATGPAGISSLRALEEITRSAEFAQKPDQSVLRQVSRALMIQKHQLSGGLGGQLGIPMGDLRPVERGFVKPYSGGLIQFFDLTQPPEGFHKNRAEIRFVGFRCHQQSESGPDEPYFIIGVQGTNQEANVTRTFGPFENVETGDNNFVGTMITTTAQPPFTIFASGMEHDSGSPSDASAEVEKQLNAGAAKLTLSLAVLGANPAIGGMVQAFVNIFGGAVGDVAEKLFGMGDDNIGQNFENMFDYNSEGMVWITPKPKTAPDFARPFNVELVLDNGEGGRYSVFLQVDLFSDDTTKV
jgi:hypothetical protein